MVSIKLKALNCLIQGIINYVQINTYWSSIVQIGIFIIVASNILLLASKKCFLTSQGLVGADMNCRALHIHSVITSSYNTANSYELILWKETSIFWCHNIIATIVSIAISKDSTIIPFYPYMTYKQQIKVKSVSKLNLKWNPVKPKF